MSRNSYHVFRLNFPAATGERAVQVAAGAVPVPAHPVHPVANPDSREKKFKNLKALVDECRKCDLHKSRTNPVFGSGTIESKLMFVGEAPGYQEDQQGIPFVGQAGKLLEQLLGRIGKSREEVFIANVLKCRPPDNRDPQASEIELCRGYLEEQIDTIQPAVICTLGNFATKLLTGKSDGISRVHGVPQQIRIGQTDTTIYPVFHPAAALYTPSNLKSLERDFDRLPPLIGSDAPQQQAEVDPDEKAGAATENTSAEDAGPEQLGLF